MDGVQLSQGYRATKVPKVPKYSWHSFDQPRKDERLSQTWSPVVLNTGSLD